MYMIEINGTLQDMDALMSQHFTETEIQVIKDTIRHGAWGNADFWFPQCGNRCVWGYVTDYTHKGGRFNGKQLSGIYSGIAKKIKNVPFMFHERDYWGNNSGSMLAVNTDDNDSLIKWSKT